MNRNSEKEEQLFMIGAIYSGEEITITRMNIPLKRIDESGFWVDCERINLVSDLINKNEVNQAKTIIVNNDNISLVLYAYKMSKFAIKMELRRVFLKTLDEQSAKIEKLIRNFEESFNNITK